MTKAVSNRDICLIKEVLLMCEHGHFSLNFASNGSTALPSIQLGLTRHAYSTFELVEMAGKVQDLRVQGRSRGKILYPASQLLY